MTIVTDIQSLLYLFEDEVPDKETHKMILDYALDKSRWSKAHDAFNRIRNKTLKAERSDDKVKHAQYCFEEVCAKTLFNLTSRQSGFDSDTPYWIAKNALILARNLEIPESKVIDIIAPR